MDRCSSKQQAERIERARDLRAGEAELVVAGGCFWGVEAYLSRLPGVRATRAGYANASTDAPLTYAQVCTTATGAAEAVWVAYAPAELSLWTLLDFYAKSVDLLAHNRQGNDIGSQYRTGLYAVDKRDLPVLTAAVAEWQEELEKAGVCQPDQHVAVEVGLLKNFQAAEAEHQGYLDRNPEGYCHIPAELLRYAEQAGTAAAESAPPKSRREQLRQELTPLQFAVTQDSATEAPFANEYDAHFESGIYVDITSGKPLFSSADKYQSGCGWPAFTRPIDQSATTARPDTSHARLRTEIRAGKSGAHLGHVFEDGPPETGGQRYCINSAALRFIPKSQMQAQGYGEWLDSVG